MHVVIFAGGNQSRFGTARALQPKQLLSLGNGETILSNILKQVETADVKSCMVAVADKEDIAVYIEKLKIKVPLIINREIDKVPSAFVVDQPRGYPITYILGDTYFPAGTLTGYLQCFSGREELELDGCIGVSEVPCGDWVVETETALVTGFRGEGAGSYWTCGVFTFVNNRSFGVIQKGNKFGHYFIDFIKLGFRLGYRSLGSDVIDLDTPADRERLEKLLKRGAK